MSVIDSFLDAIASGSGVPSSLYRDDAVLDGTVPNWRLRADGPDAISAEYGRWFAHPGRFEELERRPLADGEVVTYLLSWVEDGTPMAAHHVHVLTVGDDDRIAADRVWCGGRWPATLLAEMAAAG